MLSRAERLNTREFAKAFANGKTARHPLLSVRIVRRLDEENGATNTEIAKTAVHNAVRAAFVVPKKQAKAAGRNFLRRRMRECYRQHPALSQQQIALSKALQGCDLIFVATPLAHQADWDALNEAFAQLLRRAARLAGESSHKTPEYSSQKASHHQATDEAKPARL